MNKAQLSIAILGIITRATIAALRIAWELSIAAYRAYQASQQASADSPIAGSVIESKYAISLESHKRTETQNLETLSQVHYRLSQIVDEAQATSAIVTPRARKYAITGAIIRKEAVHAFSITYPGQSAIEVYVQNGGLL